MRDDSLARVALATLKSTPEDTSALLTLNKLCWKYRAMDFLRALRYGQEGLERSAAASFRFGEAQAANYVGVVYRNLGDYTRAMESFLRAKRIAESFNIPHELGYAYNNIGDIHRLQMGFNAALENMLKAQSIFYALRDTSGIAYCALRIGEVFQFRKQYDSALAYYDRAFRMRQVLGDTVQMSTCLMRTAQVYRTQRRFAEALVVLNRAADLARKQGAQGTAPSASNLAGLPNDIANSIARTYLDMGQYKEAIEYAEQGLRRGQQLQAKQAIETASMILSKAHAALKQYDKAFEFHELYVDMVIQLRNEEVQRNIATAQINYEIAKQEAAVALAQKDRNIQRIIIALMVIVMIMLTILVVLSTRAARARERANREILKQRALLEEQSANLAVVNEEVTRKNAALDAANSELAEQTRQLEKYLRMLGEAHANVQRQMSIQEQQSLELQVVNQQLQQKNEEVSRTLKQLQEAETQIIQSERMSAIGLMTAGIMHEINNPNAAIMGALASIQRKLDETREYFLALLSEEDRSSEAAQHMLELLRSGQEMAAVAQGGSERVKKVVAQLQNVSKHQRETVTEGNLADEIRSTIELFGYQYKNVDVLPSLPVELRMSANFGELNQVMMNLLVNAAQAGATSIAVKAEYRTLPSYKQPFVVIHVEDNGSGMSKEVQGRIFQPFYSTKGAGNSGLGLSICKGVIERHGGVIDVSSELGKGTRFAIIVPTAPTSEEQEQSSNRVEALASAFAE